MDKPNHVHVSGRKWFDRVNGNTYHSVRAWVDGELAVDVPFSYGYGEHYLQTAGDELQRQGHKWAKYPLSLHTREAGIKYTVEVVDVSRKKDL